MNTVINMASAPENCFISFCWQQDMSSPPFFLSHSSIPGMCHNILFLHLGILHQIIVAHTHLVILFFYQLNIKIFYPVFSFTTSCDQQICLNYIRRLPLLHFIYEFVFLKCCWNSSSTGNVFPYGCALIYKMSLVIHLPGEADDL